MALNSSILFYHLLILFKTPRTSWFVPSIQFCSLTYFSMLCDGTGVDLENVQTSLFIGQFNVCKTEEITCVITESCHIDNVWIIKMGQEEILRILRSSLPGRSRAGSRVSGLLVAMIILTLCSVSNPSIWFSSWHEKWTFFHTANWHCAAVNLINNKNSDQICTERIFQGEFHNFYTLVLCLNTLLMLPLNIVSQ